MNIDTQSVVKAGGAAAIIGIVLGLLSAIPLLGCLFAPLLCIGSLVLPIAAGLGYGYLAPGKEEMSESALGGALAGGFGGLVFGLVTGLVSTLTQAGSAAFLEQTDVATAAGAATVGFLFSLCLPTIGGLIFGAIGGLLWPMVQANRA